MVFIIPKWWLHDLSRSGSAIIVDRFIFDIVADLILSTHRPRATLRLFHPILKRHLVNNRCVFLICASNVVQERRPDIVWDKSYPEKVRIYAILRRLYSVPWVRTDHLSSEESIEEVIKLCK